MHYLTPIKTNRRGFTITELVTVMFIISLVVSMSLASVNVSRQKSRDNRRVADLKLIQTALELYVVNEGRDGVYPDDYPYPIRFTKSPSSPGGVSEPGIYGNQAFAKYLTNTPRDSRGFDYVYFAPGCLRPGDGTDPNPTIVSPANKKLLPAVADIRNPVTPGEHCPLGSGWLPYVLYADLERGGVALSSAATRAQFVSLSSDPKTAVYSIRKPIYRQTDIEGSLATNYIPNVSYCAPASPARPNCFSLGN